MKIDKKNKKNQKFPNKYLILGVFIFIIGSIFLLWRLEFLPSFNALWPLPLIIVGLFILYMVFFHNYREIYIILGMVLSLGGLFFLLVNTVLTEKGLGKIWPAFMLITGVSLLPYAFRKKKERYKIAIIIPSISIIILSCIFFLFSLDIMKLTFHDFVSLWWPVLIMILGISLVILYFFNKQLRNKDR